MDNAITDLLAAIIPELGAMLADMRFWLGVAMLIGPILLVLLGAYYYFLAPGEANHKAGFRTHYSGQIWCRNERRNQNKHLIEYII